jgi:hypothetical protein
MTATKSQFSGGHILKRMQMLEHTTRRLIAAK